MGLVVPMHRACPACGFRPTMFLQPVEERLPHGEEMTVGWRPGRSRVWFGCYNCTNPRHTSKREIVGDFPSNDTMMDLAREWNAV